jgi:hypothetical protein
MAGLDPAIHILATSKKGMDARVKPGHDEENAKPPSPTRGEGE